MSDNQVGRFGGANGQREADRIALLELYKNSIQPMAVDIATMKTRQLNEIEKRKEMETTLASLNKDVSGINLRLAKYIGMAVVALFIFNLITSGVISITLPQEVIASVSQVFGSFFG